MSKFQYVCSTYWYADADEHDRDIITNEIDAVYDTLDRAIEYHEKLIPALIGTKAQIRMYWDPVSNRLMYNTPGKFKFIITRVETV